MDRNETAAGCNASCPYVEAVQGSCGHDLQQSLVAYQRAHPETTCPIYRDLRVQAMEDLGLDVESR